MPKKPLHNNCHSIISLDKIGTTNGVENLDWGVYAAYTKVYNMNSSMCMEERHFDLGSCRAFTDSK